MLRTFENTTQLFFSDYLICRSNRLSI